MVPEFRVKHNKLQSCSRYRRIVLATMAGNFHPAGTEDSSEDEEGGLHLIDHVAMPMDFTTDKDCFVDLSEARNVSEVHTSNKMRAQTSPSAGANRYASKKDQQGTPFVLDDFRKAVSDGNLQEVKNLLSKGVPVDAPLRAGWTALMYAGFYGQLEIMKFLLERGADVNFNKASYLYTPIVATASSSKRKDVVISCLTTLLENGANPNVHERSHMTPLMFLSKNGNTDAVQRLLDSGAQTNRQDDRGWTALCYAAEKGYTDIVESLLSANANIHKRCQEGTAQDIAFNNSHFRVAELIGNKSALTSGEHGKNESKTAPQFNRPKPQDPSSMGDGSSSIPSGERCDDLDLFLCGLDLSHLLPLFHNHSVKFSLLLKMSDDDLVKIGIDKYGWRRRILDALHEVHKRKWEPGSVRPPSKNILSYSESLALIKNVTQHVTYIGSTMTYVGNNWKTHETSHKQEDPANLQILVNQANDALMETKCLFEELKHIRNHLLKVMDCDTVLPADVILEPESSQGLYRKWTFVFALGTVAATLYIFRDSLFKRITKMGNLY